MKRTFFLVLILEGLVKKNQSTMNNAITEIKSTLEVANSRKTEAEPSYEDLHDLLELIHKKDVIFIIGDWNAKVESQETPGITGKFGLGVRNEAGQWLVEFCQENTVVIANSLFQQHKRRLYTWYHQMVNTTIRLIIFFAAKDGEALYNQQKQD